MPEKPARPSQVPLLFIGDERSTADPERIRALDRAAHRGELGVGLPLLALGILIYCFILFFQTTNILNIRGVPHIPALGLGILPGFLVFSTGFSLTNGVLRSRLRRYLKKPDDFLVLKAVVKSAEKTRTGRAVRLTIVIDDPDAREKDGREFRQKVKKSIWDESALPPLAARIVHHRENYGEAALLAVFTK